MGWLLGNTPEKRNYNLVVLVFFLFALLVVAGFLYLRSWVFFIVFIVFLLVFAPILIITHYKYYAQLYKAYRNLLNHVRRKPNEEQRSGD